MSKHQGEGLTRRGGRGEYFTMTVTEEPPSFRSSHLAALKKVRWTEGWPLLGAATFILATGRDSHGGPGPVVAPGTADPEDRAAPGHPDDLARERRPGSLQRKAASAERDPQGGDFTAPLPLGSSFCSSGASGAGRLPVWAPGL